MRIVTLDEIKAVLPKIDLMEEIEAGFSAYSNGEVVVPPVGELNFEDPPGDVHIKYGYIRDDDVYVIKIASGFYQNKLLGLSNGQGMMVVFDQKNGKPLGLLQDEGYLTDVRTAVAGAICAKYLAPNNIQAIGIIGTGVQARMQLEYLKNVTDCRSAIVWGRSKSALNQYRTNMADSGFIIETTMALDQVTDNCNLIVMCTASEKPLIEKDQIKGKIHITAMGSDTPNKQELDSSVLSKADLIIADSRSQCEVRGEIHHAIKNKIVSMDSIVELGEIINGDRQGRTTGSKLTVADLTGVAVQDIQISKAVLHNL
jgi:ornithine cyclodeaminase